MALTVADQPGSTTVVEVRSERIAGPLIVTPAVRPSRSNIGVDCWIAGDERCRRCSRRWRREWRQEGRRLAEQVQSNSVIAAPLDAISSSVIDSTTSAVSGIVKANRCR